MLTHQFQLQNNRTSTKQATKLTEHLADFKPDQNGIAALNCPPETFKKAYDLTPCINDGWLERDNGHAVYFECFGDPTCPTTLLVHGGPGGPNANYRQLINPHQNHIVFVHQRGCGKSTPFGGLEGNHTTALVQDHLAILDHLGIHRFAIQGHSWGGPLGIAIAANAPDRVDYLVLRGPSNADKEGALRKILKTGPEQFPDYWHALVDEFSIDEKNFLFETLYQKIVLDPVPEERIRVMLNFAKLNDALSQVQVDPNRPRRDVGFEYNLYKLYFYYINHNFFLGKEKLAELVQKITAPILCVHGRHDRNCYPQNSEEIIRHAQDGMMLIVEGASHATLSPPLVNAIISTQTYMEQHYRDKPICQNTDHLEAKHKI